MNEMCIVTHNLEDESVMHRYIKWKNDTMNGPYILYERIFIRRSDAKKIIEMRAKANQS